MKKKLFLGLALLIACTAQSQINAVTETGEAVFLYEDKTWAYVEEPTELEPIAVNDQLFFKDEKATFLVKSKRINAGIWINPKEWKFEGNNLSDDAEFSFSMKGSEVYGMLITERVGIPLETLGNIALMNARSASPDAKITKEEYRNVNGVELLMLQISATIQGIRFQYYGYYYTSESGSLQLLTWTYQNVFSEYEATMENFLNGLVKVQD